MTAIMRERVTAEMDGDFVVFLIGMRINSFWKVHKWLPVANAMQRMLAELRKDPAAGLLHVRPLGGIRNLSFVQYWRSFAHLHAYATSPEREHLPAWRAFNRAVASNGDVGIWHETFLVRAGEHESVYNNMPLFGMGAAGRIVPAKGMKSTAKRRLGQSDDAPAIEP